MEITFEALQRLRPSWRWKRVYRSKGKGRGKRVKTVLRH